MLRSPAPRTPVGALVKVGLNIPPFGELADPRALADLATEAEEAGWNGFFVWDHVLYRRPVAAVTDPWIALAAAAGATSTIRIGQMVTPLARRRPQIVARQAAALDLLTGGRFVLGVGLGLDDSGGEFVRFDEETDVRRRAEMYDEALELVEALLSGARVDHKGRFFTAADVQFLPAPRKVPIWVAARWPNRRPIQRALRRDGLFVIDIAPSELGAVSELINQRAATETFELIVQSADPRHVEEWKTGGATWWLAAFSPFDVSVEGVRSMIRRRVEIGSA